MNFWISRIQLVGSLCPGYGWESSTSGPKTSQAPEVELWIHESAPNTTERWIFVITPLSFPNVVFSWHLPFSLHSQSTKFKTEVFGNQLFWWMLSVLVWNIYKPLPKYVSYSSLTWTCLKYSKAAVWSLLQQGPRVLPQRSHKAASALHEVAVLEVVDILSSWRGSWESINIRRKNSN